MKTYLGIFLLSIPALLCSCSDEDGRKELRPTPYPDDVVVVPTTYEPVELSESEIAGFQVDANKFALNLADAAATPGENLVLSPFSAYYALSMLANGAVGETRTEMLTALGASQPDLDKLNSYNHGVVAKLTNLADAKFMVANSLWKTSDIVVNPLFDANLRLCYDAETFDLNPATIVDDFNNWCAEKTEGVIDNAAVEEMKQTPMILANASFFSAPWSNLPYSPENTKPDTFTNSDGTQTTIDFLNGTRNTGYCNTDSYEALQLSLGNSSENFIYFILPKPGISVEGLISTLNKSGWESFVKGFDTYEVKHKFPKFRVENQTDLTEFMPKIGINAFSGNADFSNMTEQKLSPDLIYQNNCIEANEEGVTAVSITAELMVTSPGWKFEKAEINIDRPFLFVIYSRTAKTITYLGAINKLH